MPLYYSERDTQTNVINVKQYGALGNGTTDDTAAIQAAINAALTDSFHLDNVTGEPIVFFPPGDYVISSTLLLDTTLGNKITIEGSGPNISRIVAASSFTGTVMLTSNTDVIGQTATEDRILYGCAFKNFGLFCQTGMAGRVDNGILFHAMAHSRIERVWVSYAAKCGVIINWGYTNYFEQVRVDNVAYHGFVMGLDACEVANQYTFVNCVAVGCNKIGYYFNGGIGYTMTGCNAEGCKEAGIYTNRVHGLSINGAYFENVGASGIGFTLFNGSAMPAGTWTVKANIILNGVASGINSSTYNVPLGVSRAFPTEGVVINGHTYQNSSGVSFIAFAGCDGVNVNGYAANSPTTLAPDFLFNASHALATNISIDSHGSVNKKQNAISLYDVGRSAYQAPFNNVTVRDVDFPIIDIPISGLIMVEAGVGSGIYAPSTFSYRGVNLYRLGDTVADTQTTDYYGGYLNFSQYPHLRGKYASLVIEWLPAFNFNDIYALLYNGAPRLQFNAVTDTSSVMATTATEVQVIGTISGGSPTLNVTDATGLKIGDFIQVSLAGSGANPGAHFSRITNIAGTTITLSDNATTSATSVRCRTSVPRQSYVTILCPSTTETVKYGIQRIVGRQNDAVYIASVKIIPFGVKWPYMGE